MVVVAAQSSQTELVAEEIVVEEAVGLTTMLLVVEVVQSAQVPG